MRAPPRSPGAGRVRAFWLLPALLLLLGAGPAGADTPPVGTGDAPGGTGQAGSGKYEVRVERSPGVKPSSPNFVPITVTVTDAATKGPPAENFTVAAYATYGGSEETPPYDCGQAAYMTVGVPRGIYECTVIVDHGGTWTFHGVVNSIPEGAKSNKEVLERTVTVARGSSDILIDAPTLAGEAPDIDAIEGDTSDVLLLQSHALFALLWGLGMAMLIAVALPAARRALSTPMLHRLEDHLTVITRSTLAFTAVVLGTGIWLLLYQTAYEAPFSPSEADAVFLLPYGKPYFLSLWIKLGAYALMLVFMVPVIREAHRRIRLVSEDGVLEQRPRRRDSVWQSASAEQADHAPAPAGPWRRPQAKVPPGTTTTLERPSAEGAGAANPPEAAAPAHGRRGARRLVAVGTGVMAVGGLVILMCVTLLKYFHELIEASSALLR